MKPQFCNIETSDQAVRTRVKVFRSIQHHHAERSFAPGAVTVEVANGAAREWYWRASDSTQCVGPFPSRLAAEDDYHDA